MELSKAGPSVRLRPRVRDDEGDFSGLVDSLLLAVVGLGFIALLVRYWGFVVDDTFISLRYARHLARGHGFVFNLGEAPSEGFTSFAWVVLLAAADLSGVDLLLASQVLSLAATVAAVVVVVLICRRLPLALSNTSLVMVIGLLLVNTRLASHAISGMETALFTLTLTLVSYLAMQMTQATERGGEPLPGLVLAFGGSVLLAGLTRPEGVLFGALTLLAVVMLRPRILGSPKCLRTLTLAIGVGAGYFLMRWHYFGHPLPNSFYHKRPDQTLISPQGFEYTLSFARFVLPLVVLSAVTLWLGKMRRVSLLFLIPLASLAVPVFFYPEMGYNFRFLAPYYFLLVVLAVPAVEAGLAALRQRFRPPLGSVAAAMAALLLVGTQARGLSDAAVPVDFYAASDGPHGNRVRLAKILAALPADTVLGAGEMGVIPWYSGLETIDLAGLTDSHLAHHALTMDYLLERRVEVLVLPAAGRSLELTHPTPGTVTGYRGVERIWNDVTARFRLVGCWDRGTSFYLVYLRRDSPRTSDLAALLDRAGLPKCDGSDPASGGAIPEGGG